MARLTRGHAVAFVQQRLDPFGHLDGERAGPVPEPSSSAAFAALRSGREKAPLGKRVACVLSGGNIDCARLKTLL